MSTDTPQLEPGYYWATSKLKGGRQIVRVVAHRFNQQLSVETMGWDDDSELDDFTDYVPVAPEGSKS